MKRTHVVGLHVSFQKSGLTSSPAGWKEMTGKFFATQFNTRIPLCLINTLFILAKILCNARYQFLLISCKL